MKKNAINAFGRGRAGFAQRRRYAIAASVLAVVLALAPAPALALADLQFPDAGDAVASAQASAPEVKGLQADAALAGAASDATSDDNGSGAAVGAAGANDLASAVEASDADEKTYSVTFYHTEAVYYDDPTYVPEDDPRYAGYRLLRPVTIDGFKAGDVVQAWDYIGREPGFTFYDGWPREIVVSEDESKNAFQLNYYRNMSDCTINHYVISGAEEGALDVSGASLPGGQQAVAPELKVTKVATESLENQLFLDALDSETFADVSKLANPENPEEVLEGMTLVGAYPQKLQVMMDPQKNEISLFYADTAVNLPDEVPVEDADSDQGNGGAGPDGTPNVPGTGDGGSGSDGSNGAAGGSGADSGNGADSDDGVADGGNSGSGSGASGGDAAGSRPHQSISDNETPLADGGAHAGQLPRTGDSALLAIVSLAGIAAAALVAIVAVRARRRN